MCDHLWGLICVRRARRDTISGEGRMPRCSDGPTQGCPGGNYPPGTLCQDTQGKTTPGCPAGNYPQGTAPRYPRENNPLGTQEEATPRYAAENHSKSLSSVGVTIFR